MTLTKVGYYKDFVVYPAALAALAMLGLVTTTAQGRLIWLAVFLCGTALWTLIEYLLHRFVLHRLPYIRELHEAHHNDQMALIGTPTWLSAFAIVGIAFLPLSFIFDLTITVGLTSGLMLGYLWYISAHHVIHHWQSKPGTYGYRLKRRHMLHHHFDPSGNFGVTSGLWDKVFRTNINPRLDFRS